MSLYRQVPEGWKPELAYQDFLSKRKPTPDTQKKLLVDSLDAVTIGKQRALEVAARMRAAHPAVGELAVEATVDLPAHRHLQTKNVILSRTTRATSRT
jgi:hypothetical protein